MIRPEQVVFEHCFPIETVLLGALRQRGLVPVTGSGFYGEAALPVKEQPFPVFSIFCDEIQKGPYSKHHPAMFILRGPCRCPSDAGATTAMRGLAERPRFKAALFA
ncbi:MAG: hypothetical protein C4519_09235 [Desulfobacteraceae bacterium]|nr:MAG: hypothetical protein C4519_09235 [Desulfobacteraceae bacterium]